MKHTIRHYLYSVLAAAVTAAGILPAAAQEQQRPITVSENGHYLQYADGRPFFYQGDTAWELFHRLDREQADLYLRNRAAKGFNVIQAVALAELDGVDAPNAYGHLPLTDRDPSRPAVKDGEQNDYWDHVDYIVRRANELGMYIGLLPTWGRYWNEGKVIFDERRVEAMREKFDVYIGMGASVVLVWNLAREARTCGFTFGLDDPLLKMINEYQPTIDSKAE